MFWTYKDCLRQLYLNLSRASFLFREYSILSFSIFFVDQTGSCICSFNHYKFLHWSVMKERRFVIRRAFCLVWLFISPSFSPFSRKEIYNQLTIHQLIPIVNYPWIQSSHLILRTCHCIWQAVWTQTLKITRVHILAGKLYFILCFTTSLVTQNYQLLL